jgi:predicted nuclease with RNAse H fold
VKTVGIDLAARDENTAMCVIDWSAREARVQVPTVGHDDDALIAAISESDRAGIDAPFGWPQAFADAVTAHQARKAWPGSEKELRALAEDRVRYRNRLAYRLTDLAVIDDPKLAVRPLSVSTDRIGVTTFRCALLLDRLANEKGLEVDRSGRTGTVAEVYPAAALNAWRMEHKGYKRGAGRPARRELVEQLRGRLGRGLGSSAREACEASDHALDALIAALVARAVAVGRTRPPDAELASAAQAEGWIHVPTCGVAELREP